MRKSLRNAPRVAVLGIAERAGLVRDGDPITWRHNLIGLRAALVSLVYPCSGSGWSIVFAVYDPASLGKVTIRLLDENRKQLFRIDASFEECSGSPTGTKVEQLEWRLTPTQSPSWFLLSWPLSDLHMMRTRAD